MLQIELQNKGELMRLNNIVRKVYYPAFAASALLLFLGTVEGCRGGMLRNTVFEAAYDSITRQIFVYAPEEKDEKIQISQGLEEDVDSIFDMWKLDETIDPIFDMPESDELSPAEEKHRDRSIAIAKTGIYASIIGLASSLFFKKRRESSINGNKYSLNSE